MPVIKVFALPGVAVILVVIFAWMLAHNTFYTYIACYLRFADVGLSTQMALVTFGISAIAGVGETGLLIDRALRLLVLTSIASFVVAGVIFAMAHQSSGGRTVRHSALGCGFRRRSHAASDSDG